MVISVVLGCHSICKSLFFTSIRKTVNLFLKIFGKLWISKYKVDQQLCDIIAREFAFINNSSSSATLTESKNYKRTAIIDSQRVTLYLQEDTVVLNNIIVCEKFVKLHTCECKLNHENDLRDHSNFNILSKQNQWITQSKQNCCHKEFSFCRNYILYGILIVSENTWCYVTKGAKVN